MSYYPLWLRDAICLIRGHRYAPAGKNDVVQCVRCFTPRASK